MLIFASKFVFGKPKLFTHKGHIISEKNAINIGYVLFLSLIPFCFWVSEEFFRHDISSMEKTNLGKFGILAVTCSYLLLPMIIKTKEPNTIVTAIYQGSLMLTIIFGICWVLFHFTATPLILSAIVSLFAIFIIYINVIWDNFPIGG